MARASFDKSLNVKRVKHSILGIFNILKNVLTYREEDTYIKNIRYLILRNYMYTNQSQLIKNNLSHISKSHPKIM